MDLAVSAGDVAAEQQIVRAFFDAGALAGSDRRLPFLGELSEAGWPLVQRLVALGILKYSADEFGDSEFQLDARQVEWSLRNRLGRPCLPHWCDLPHDAKACGKLSLLLALRRAGFREDKAPMPLVPGADLVYDIQALSKSKAYLQALLEHQKIFGKGVNMIRHTCTQSYYLCLLHLPGEQLASLADDLDELSSRRLLKAALGDDDAPEGGPLAIEWSHGAESDPEEIESSIAKQLWGGFAAAPPSAFELMVEGQRVVVNQTWSHSSGLLRMYVRCPNGQHWRCFRYTQRNQYDSDQSCAAFLIGWAALGSALPTKDEHKVFHPSAMQVAEIAARLG